MGLRNTINSGVNTAFAALGDLIVSIKYVPPSSPGEGYDTDLGLPIGTIPTPIDIPQAAVLDYKDSEIDNENILPDDKKVIINNLQNIVKISRNGHFLLPDLLDKNAELQRHDIKHVSTDPTGSLSVYRARKP